MKYVTSLTATMRYFAVVLLLVLCSARCHGDDKMDDTQYSGLLADMWLEGADIIKILWRDCSKKLIDVKDVIDHKEYFPKFVRCMKRKTLRALDRSLGTDVVPIADGINLVRFEMVDRSGNVMSYDNETSYWTEKELDEGEWRTLALHRMARVLRTHVIKFDFDQSTKTTETVEYRGRRRHQMMTMMMFGIVSIGMVLVPMGFQFLAVLGGKALLLAKMALILASIQGLKKVDILGGSDATKIASSPVSYGFYHSYPPPPPPPPFEHFEKRSNVHHSEPISPRHSPWPNLEASHLKYDRVAKDSKRMNDFTPEIPKAVKSSEPRVYPVYADAQDTYITSIDAPTTLSDLTTRPGEVQADFSVDLPFNGIRFQSPAPVVSS